MRKSLVWLSLLAVLVCVGSIWSAGQIYSQKESVIITQQVLEGDVQAADGITFQVGSQWAGRFDWNTTVTIDGAVENGKVESETTFDAAWNREATMRSRSLYPEVLMNLYYRGNYHASYGGGVSEKNIDLSMDFPKAVRAVASRTEAGQSHTEIISLADYYDYYPLEVELYLDESMIWKIDFSSYFENALQIQVPESHKIEMTIVKGENGKIYEVKNESQGGVNIQCFAADGGAGVYFTFCGKNEDGSLRKLDSKEGNGIYYLPYVKVEKGLEIQHEKLKKVFSLEHEESCPMELKMDDNGDLLLVTSEDGNLMFRRIVVSGDGTQSGGNAAGGVATTGISVLEEKECLTLMSHRENSAIYIMDQVDGNIFLLLENGDISFLAAREDGGYERKISGEVYAEIVYSDSRNFDYDLDYRDGRLALIIGEGFYRCSAFVYVFDGEGLQYKGYYRHSADYEDVYGGVGVDLKERENKPLRIWFS